LQIPFVYVILKQMLKKIINIFISILLLLPLYTGTFGFSSLGNNSPPSFQKPCDMDHCTPYMPKCPLCPSSGSINLYLHYEVGNYLPVLASSFILSYASTLSDQGVIKAIFRPPTSIS